MKVLHLTSSFPRHEEDHHAPFMAELMRAQAAVGIEALVLAPHDGGLALRQTLAGVEVIRFRYAPSGWERLAYRGGLMSTAGHLPEGLLLPSFLAAFAARAARLARARRVDVIHAHWWLPAGLAAVVAARLAAPLAGGRAGRLAGGSSPGIPLVITCHGSDVELARRPALRRVARTVLGRAAAVGAVSEALADVIRAELGRPDCTLLRMPVALPQPGSTALFATLPSSTAPAPAPGEVVLKLVAAGRLSPEKGFDVAIEAVNRLAAAGRAVQLQIIGAGPEEERLRGMAGAAVRLVGPRPPGEVGAAMSASHAVVVPSRHEGLGLVALEALARRRPVIASAVGGLAEVVGPGDGLLVPAGDVDALVEALGRLPLPEPAGAAVAAHHPDTVGQTHLALYRSLLEGRS